MAGRLSSSANRDGRVADARDRAARPHVNL